MNKIYISLFSILLLISTLFATGCKDDNEQTSGSAQLLEFRVTNAGTNEDVIVEGVINDADQYVELRVPFETNLKKLKFETKVSDGARFVPNDGKEYDFTEERKFVAINGMNTKVYTILFIKEAPVKATVMSLKAINESDTEYPIEINYKTKTIEIQLFSGYTTKVKLTDVLVGPTSTTYTIEGLDADGFINLNETPAIKVKNKDDEFTFAISKKLLPIGADFADYMKSPVIYSVVLSGSNNRDAHMANGVVYIPTRTNGNHIYYWDATRALTGVSDPAGELSLEGLDMSGTTWAVSSVYAVGEKIYVASMANAKNQKLKVWYWANKTAKPTEILNYTIDDAVAPSTKVRLGDAFSVAVDAAGNGKMFFSNFPFQNPNNQFYTFEVTGYTTVKNTPDVINLDLGGAYVGQYGRVNAIPGETDMYTVTGADMGIAVIQGNGAINYLLSSDVIQGRAQDARVIHFNKARYLVYTVNREWDANGAFGEIVNISEGATVADALKLLKASNIESRKLNMYLLSPGKADPWVSATSSAEIINNELLVMNFSTLNGFGIQKFKAAK